MLHCEQRQTVVKRGQEGSLTILRCLNKHCELQGQKVDEGVCSRCPVRVEKHVRPCYGGRGQSLPDKPPKAHVTAEEMINVTDAEFAEMIRDAGMDPKDLERSIEPVGSGQPPPNYPPLSMQVWAYKEALIRWAKAGRPTRSQEEVEHLLNTHCKTCDWFDPEQSRCKGCGCKVSESAIAVINKLKMATESCPKEKF